MTMTDPIADMLTRIRNATKAGFEEARMPTSKLKESVCRVLEREGYIEGFSTEDDPSGKPQRFLVVRLKYTKNRKPVISGLQRVSKPGHRKHQRSGRVPRVLNGMGIAILSTDQGVITDREARERKVGGEVLCEVW